MAHHVPDEPGRFLCKSSDLLRLTAKEGDKRQRREVEANRFATLILMPPQLLRKAMAAFPGADLRHVLALACDFAVAKETAARAFMQYHPERTRYEVGVLHSPIAPILRAHHDNRAICFNAQMGWGDDSGLPDRIGLNKLSHMRN